ncbi:peptidase S41 [Chitinophaga silvatica]|uniref:Peptidase S41 n=1 Tax=Chitinophaga silvatica TaxID=2282649 RepID=A0A3E1Y9V9_9BACT|nr:S41 family peptidase [Chitinophaga silvatica]RFS22416.1 peptidase S41 [Chitinophaga silvatica]
MKKRITLFLYSLAILALVCQPALAQLTDQQERNLTAFAKMYGYVQYFHPSDESATTSWDQFAIYGVNKVMSAKDDDQLLGVLNELFKPIAPAALIYKGKEPSLPNINPINKNDYNIVAWQHTGVGVKNSYNAKSGTYKSIRINRPVIKISEGNDGFAPTSIAINTDSLRGKAFSFTGWLKVNAVGTGALFARVDKKYGPGFFDNMGNRPASENTWKQYTIEGIIDKDAEQLVLGAMLIGEGDVWIDDLHLKVKEGNNWKEVPLENGSFENHDENNKPDNWWTPNKTNYRLICQQQEKKEGKSALLISSITEFLDNGKLAKPIFDKYPKPGEYIRQTLVSGISCSVPLALYGDNDHTYPTADNNDLETLHSKYISFASNKRSGDSLDVRLAGVIISWNIFRHFFPYWNDASVQPDELLHSTLLASVSDKTAEDFRVTLERMLGKLHDGHMRVYLPGSGEMKFLPVILARGDDKVVVKSIIDSTLLDRVAPGDIVTAINGRPVEEVINEMKERVSGSSQYKDVMAFARLSRDSYFPVNNLTLLHKGNKVTIEVTRNSAWEAYVKGSKQRVPAGWIKPDIYYLDLDAEPMDSIKARMNDLTKAKAIICDLRGYPNSNHELITHLLKKEEDTKWMFVPKIIYPNYQEPDFIGFGWNLKPQSPYLSAKIYFLTDGQAISYAESYMGFIKDFKLATIIGSPTAGTNGNINPFTLPGGYNVSWTGMLVKNHDGSKHHLTGIVPDILVKPSVKGIAEERDEVLEKAISMAQQ